MSVGESSIVSQYLDFYQATIFFSLTLGFTFYFNLGTNILELYTISNYVPCKSQIMSIV